jgi:GntR family histidine utilization transcriptional repressor
MTKMSEDQKLGYKGVKDVIVDRIKNKVWRPGSMLPGEIEFATVNRAMRELADDGIVERKRKAGTRVAGTAEQTAKFKFPIARLEIEKTGAAYRYALIDRTVGLAPAWLRARMKLAGNAQIVHLRCMHYADEHAFQFEERWINMDVVPDAETADFETSGPSDWLAREVPFSDAEMTFSAIAADRNLSDFLSVSVGEPIFSSERLTWLHGEPVTFARLNFGRGYRMTTYL